MMSTMSPIMSYSSISLSHQQKFTPVPLSSQSQNLVSSIPSVAVKSKLAVLVNELHVNGLKEYIFSCLVSFLLPDKRSLKSITVLYQ